MSSRSGWAYPVIVCFGSINLDLIFPLPHLPLPGQTVLGPRMTIEPGGKGANQAVAAARDGARVRFAGAVGRDALAEDALALMRTIGVDLVRVVQADTATGCAAICVDPAGENLIAVASGANLAARHAQIEDALLSPATTVLMQGESDPDETAALIRRARARGARVILNLAPPGFDRAGRAAGARSAGGERGRGCLAGHPYRQRRRRRRAACRARRRHGGDARCGERVGVHPRGRYAASRAGRSSWSTPPPPATASPACSPAGLDRGLGAARRARSRQRGGGAVLHAGGDAGKHAG